MAAQKNPQAAVDGDVLVVAVSGLDEPGASLGDVGGEMGRARLSGIESLLEALAHGLLLLGFGALPADFAQAGAEHRRGSDRGGSEGEDHHRDGQEDQHGEKDFHRNSCHLPVSQ